MDFTHTSPQRDPHSFSQPTIARVTHADWDLTVDFQTKKIKGKGTYQISHEKATEVIFDVHGLSVLEVWLEEEQTPVNFTLTPPVPFLGQGLKIPLRPETKTVTISFETTEASTALQWLEPAQTEGKQQPFLFTQSQAILARTWLPCQDSPGVRFTYTARVRVPDHLLPLMSAQNPTQKNGSGLYHFRMNQAIPSYLLSLAVGDLVFAPLGNRCGVYAEPSVLQAAASEFSETEQMLLAAEALYGLYPWERYDLLVLPPSFPFGGMENPKLTFVTPTIIAGDRSLTSLVAHELAHSWSGNLVTNATWNDFWLNEGFTVYFERRIMEALNGADYAQMLHTLGYQDLLQTLEELKDRPEDTRLKLSLEGRDADEGLTEIAYEKGNLFLCYLEQLVGREKFDQFVSKYFNTFRFQSMDTERFILFLEKELLNATPGLKEKANVPGWVYMPGLPDNAPTPTSVLFAKVDQQLNQWQTGVPAAELATNGWSSHEWLHFLRNLPRELPQERMQELDNAFGFTASGNAELLAQWLLLSIKVNYTQALPVLEEFLTHVGRRKFLVPLYTALLKTPNGTQKAKELFSRAQPNYHSVAANTIAEMLGNR